MSAIGILDLSGKILLGMLLQNRIGGKRLLFDMDLYGVFVFVLAMSVFASSLLLILWDHWKDRHGSSVDED
jgi:hypothetical protein